VLSQIFTKGQAVGVTLRQCFTIGFAKSMEGSLLPWCPGGPDFMRIQDKRPRMKSGPSGEAHSGASRPFRAESSFGPSKGDFKGSKVQGAVLKMEQVRRIGAEVVPREVKG
jgi:hypothetical protein